MGAGAAAVFTHDTDEDAVLADLGGEFGAGHAGLLDVEEDEVGVGALDRDAGDLGELAGEQTGVLVIFGQAVDVMVQRVEASGGADAGLAHGAADPLFPAPGFADEVGRSGEDGAKRGAEALGEIEPDGVVAGAHLGSGDPGGNDGVHQAGAVHVGDEAGFVGGFGDVVELGNGPDAAATEVGGLFDLDHALGWGVAVFRADGVADGLGGEEAVIVGQRGDLHTGEGGGRAAFGVQDVAEGWARISSPRRHCTRMATSLHMVPEGMKTAASLPRRAAMRSQSSLVVGSAPDCSSPTSASIIASFMARDGLVWVSE